MNYAWTQVTQWNFQNKGKSDWTGTSSFVLLVPLCNLRPSIIYSVPCDQIVPRAYFMFVCFLCYCIPSHVKLCFLQIACNKLESSWIVCQLVWTFSIELRISEALFCKLISSAHTRGHVVKQRQVPSCARKGPMMQEACAHEAKRLLVHF